MNIVIFIAEEYLHALPSPYLTLRQARQRTPWLEWQTEHSVLPVFAVTPWSVCVLEHFKCNFTHKCTTYTWLLSVTNSTPFAIFFPAQLFLPALAHVCIQMKLRHSNFNSSFPILTLKESLLVLISVSHSFRDINLRVQGRFVLSGPRRR